MKYFNVIMNGCSYGFRTNADMSEMNVINTTTARRITSTKTIAKLLALFPESEQYQADHAEALEMNAEIQREESAKDDGHIRWLNFFGGNDYAARRAIVEASHVEALRMDAQMMQDAWDNADCVGREMAIEFAHDEALTMDTEYRIAIATIADNLTLPVWDGCSATVKREVVKHHHAEALRENQKHDEAIIYFAERGPQIVVEAFTEIQMRQIIAYCHGQALKMDAARTVY